VAIHGEMGEEGLDLSLTIFQIVPGAHFMKQYIPCYPRTVTAFSPDRVVPASHGATHFIQQFCGHRLNGLLKRNECIIQEISHIVNR